VRCKPGIVPSSSAHGWRCGWLVLLAWLLGACTAPPPENDFERPPLRIGLHAAPSSLDPHLQSETVAQSLLGNVYEGLVGFDDNMGLVPALAVRWENPDELTWRFELREGVVFHDGSELTVDDVVASLERARHHPESKIAGFLVAVDAIRPVGRSGLELHTADPYPILLNKLAYVAIAPREAPEEITEPVGTGPYRWVRFDPAEGAFLEAFEGHWREAPSEPRVVFRFLDDPEARLAGLLAGELDLVDELPAHRIVEVEQRGDLRVEARSSLGVEYLQMDVSVPPFDDLRVRRAIDLALDREALVEEMVLGQGVPVGQMVSPNVFGYDPALLAVERDLAESRRLLAEAGHPEGLELELEVREGRPVEPIVEQLAEAGIRVEIAARPWSEMYPRLSSGEVAFYYGGWIATSVDASDLFDHKIHTPERGYGNANSNQYSNPELDRLIEAIDAAPTLAERRELLQEASARLAEDLAFLPLYSPFELYGLDADLDWRPRQDGRVYAAEMER